MRTPSNNLKLDGAYVVMCKSKLCRALTVQSNRVHLGVLVSSKVLVGWEGGQRQGEGGVIGERIR